LISRVRRSEYLVSPLDVSRWDRVQLVNEEDSVLGDTMVKHTFSGSCRGGPLDGQSLEHHQNVYRIFERPSYELLGEYWHQDGQWAWRPSSKKTNDVNRLEKIFIWLITANSPPGFRTAATAGTSRSLSGTP
jgi:hypothetical protein